MKEQLNAGNSFCSLDDQSLFFSIILAAIGISKADSVLVIVVISLFVLGFLVAWAGKLGAYWIHG